MLINKSMYPVKAGYSAISTMQAQLGKLQTQLGSGQKSTTLAEMGFDRTVSLATHNRLTKLDSFAANIDTVNLRLNFLDQAFTALDALKSETRNSASPTGYGENNLTMASLQKNSENRLSQLVEMLNLSVAGRYLMGGNKTDSAPVASMSAIMDGVGTRDGYKTVVNERNAADLGPDVATTLKGVGLPNTRISGPHGSYLGVSSNMFDKFGYSLTSISSNTTNIKTDGPSTNPLNQTAYFSQVPTNGNTFTVTLKQQDGTVLTRYFNAVATLTVPSVPSEFQIVPGDAAGTAANFQAALEATVGGDLDEFSSISAVAAIGTGAAIPADTAKFIGDADGTPNIGIKFTENPTDGEELSVVVRRANGTSETIRFIAADPANGPLGPEDFEIGANRRETMENLEAAMAQRIGAMEVSIKTGRLDVTMPASDTVAVSKPAGVAFGFGELTSISTTVDNAVVTPAPTPSVRFTGPVTPGESVSFAVAMPDGTSTQIRLEAVDRNPGVGQFRIGATPQETASNFAAAVNVQLNDTARTELVAASTFAAADDFFTKDGVARRIDISGGAENATAYAAPGTRDTVQWYTGEVGTAGDNPRLSATAQVDDSTKVGYGVRANETGLVEMMRTLAAMSVQDYPLSDPTSKPRFSAMVERQMANMSTDTATEEGSIEQIGLELGVVRATVGGAAERNTAFSGQLETLLSEVETVSMEETVMQLLALKTRLEASYQTTASVANLSLVNYLK